MPPLIIGTFSSRLDLYSLIMICELACNALSEFCFMNKTLMFLNDTDLCTKIILSFYSLFTKIENNPIVYKHDIGLNLMIAKVQT